MCGRPGRGTNSASACIQYNEIAMSQQTGEQCNVFLRDVSKSYDKVWHQGIKFKICQLGLPQNLAASLCNFLDNRSANIQIKNYTGELFSRLSGVPKSSCLSPTLFSVFMAEIPHSVLKTE